jgi:glucosyl-dolichyl phosphate glucuronosyltransferase
MLIATIVICTRNRCTSLRETLLCLSAVPVPAGLTAEVVVVDNGSTDETQAYLSSVQLPGYRLKVLRETAGGKSVAINTALRSSQGDLILCIDDDVRPARDWLDQITRPLIEGRYDAVAGNVGIPHHLIRPWMRPAHFAWLASTASLAEASPETAVGANMAFTRKVLARVPAFDPELGPGRLGLWEDTLFSLQLRKAGYRLGMAPQAVVEHHFDPSRLTRAAFLGRARSEARSSAYVAWHWKHERRHGLTARVTEYSARLALKRMLYPRDWRRHEGVAQWEMDLVTGIEFERSYRREAKRPPVYEQYGTRKRGTERVETGLDSDRLAESGGFA